MSARILHTPFDVGGNAWGLSRGERELGFHSDVAVFEPGPLGYKTDIDMGAGLGVPIPVRFAKRAAFLRKALKEYDVFHYNFGQTLLTVRQGGRVWDEAHWVKRAGKTVLITYQGCDVRPLDRCFCRNRNCFETERYRQPAADRLTAVADRVLYLNPDLALNLPEGAQFSPYASVDARELTPVPQPEREGIVIAHAPTNRPVKGTAHVIAAIQVLQDEGFDVTLDLLEGITHDEVRQRIATADIVVDQLMLGWYGGFAVEAMALARPVVCNIGEDNPFGDALPIVNVTTETLTGELRALCGDAERRARLGEASREFALTAHDPRRAAREALEGLVEFP